MKNEQSTGMKEAGQNGLLETLFSEIAPKLRNLKCFVGEELATDSDLSRAANKMIANRRSGKVGSSKTFDEKPKPSRTAAELIASL